MGPEVLQAYGLPLVHLHLFQHVIWFLLSLPWSIGQGQSGVSTALMFPSFPQGILCCCCGEQDTMRWPGPSALWCTVACRSRRSTGGVTCSRAQNSNLR